MFCINSGKSGFHIIIKMEFTWKTKSVLALLVIFSAVIITTESQKQLWKSKDFEKLFRRRQPMHDRGDVIRRIAAPVLALSTALQLNHLV